MAILITIITLVLIVVVLFVISAPLRNVWATTPTEPVEEDDRGVSGRSRPAADDAKAGEIELEDERIQLETAREAKYREIRDTELDYRTGKLSQEDFAATDGALRAEAVEILDRLAAVDAIPKPEVEG
jgi:hypothetical protein